MARPSNTDLLYLIANKLEIVNPHTGELYPRYERMLHPAESNTMTASEAREVYGEETPEGEEGEEETPEGEGEEESEEETPESEPVPTTLERVPGGQK